MNLITRVLVGFVLLASSLQAEQPTPNFTLLIPMRDGTELPTDIYLPEDAQLKEHPCILMRNPSGRRAQPWVQYGELAKYGYIVAIQDARNVIDPEGKTMPYWSDGWGKEQDGYDTVEWLAKSPFTDGNIGTIGFSAPGITQLLMAPSAPPSLKCQYVGVAAANLYEQCAFNGGQVLKNQVEGWLACHGDDKDLLTAVTSQPHYNEFWDQLNTVNVADRVNVPAIHYGGWYDIFLNGTIDAFASRNNNGGEGAKGKQKMLIGPWTHQWPANTKLGDFDVPEQGRIPPYDFSPVQWFDHHLKGKETHWDSVPAVTYYVMGPFDGTPSKGNVWKTADTWPVPAEEKVLYLSMDHQLTEKAIGTGSKHYDYDPENPTPTNGGRNLFLESGPKDQRIIEERDDVIVFTSEPLEEDLEVTGQIVAKIFFGSDQEDTDLAVRLTDVYPDGKSILITDGIQRIAHQRCVKGAGPCDGPEEVEVDLFSTSMVFAKGHRIRISLTSSNYPRYEKNLNVAFLNEGETHKVAHNSIYFGGNTPSKIVLPVVR